MYPILFSIGPIHIFSFSLLIVLAWLVFSFIFWKYLHQWILEEERIFDMTFYTTLVALASSRLVYVILNFNLFSSNYFKIFALWVTPGLSFYGGLIGGVISIFYLSRRYKVRLAHMLDALSISLPIPLVFGEIGSFLDATVVGKVTNLPIGVLFPGHLGKRHPVQIYELFMLICIYVLIIYLNKVAKAKKWPYGILGICFFTLFSFGFFVLEFVKDSSVYFSSLNTNQWILIVIFGESLGAYYVRGGGREKIKPKINLLFSHIKRKLGDFYAKFSHRTA